MSVIVKFDGRCYRAYTSGRAGFVFGDTAAEAISRAGMWRCAHPPKLRVAARTKESGRVKYFAPEETTL
jgi:hypothetical protein